MFCAIIFNNARCGMSENIYKRQFSPSVNVKYKANKHGISGKYQGK